MPSTIISRREGRAHWWKQLVIGHIGSAMQLHFLDLHSSNQSRCNCIGFEKSQILNNSITAYFKYQLFAHLMLGYSTLFSTCPSSIQSCIESIERFDCSKVCSSNLELSIMEDLRGHGAYSSLLGTLQTSKEFPAREYGKIF